MPRILIVDDDPAIRDVLRYALTRAGHAVTEAADGAAGLSRVVSDAPDLIVLDVMLPEMDGTEVCRAIRLSGNPVPILFLSSRDDEVDRVVGLEIGGDDYLTKPFSPRELVARVRAILRRGATAAAPVAATRAAATGLPEGPVAAAPPTASPRAADAEDAPILRHGRLALDPNTARATWDGAEVPLTATEFGLLRTLMRRPGRVLTRDALMDGAYTVERVVSDRTIDSHVRRLRQKFAAVNAAPVETLAGFGYRLGPCDQ